MDAVDDEAMLVARAKVDRQAFAALYGRYFGMIYRYCYARLGTWEAAEDATSQVFAKALAALAACRDQSFGPWLFTIARNVVADVFRARRPEDPLSVAVDLPAVDPTPEEIALVADERRSLHAMLSRLPADQRQVLELRLAGLTGAEIAELLGRTLASVKMLQVRAVARLRVLMDVDATEEVGRRG